MIEHLRPKQVWANGAILICFVLAGAAGVSFVVTYYWNASPQLLGTFFGVAFALLAIGLVLWAKHFLPEGPFEEQYPELRSTPDEEAEALAAMDRGGVARRKVLIGSLGIVGGSVVIGVGSSLRSLGPGPSAYAGTPWKGGRVAVTPENTPVHLAGMPVNSIATVYPQGFIDAPMSPAVLIRLPPGVNHPLRGRQGWAPDDLICYSKICSHAGCPVGLYDHSTFQLECPCHQSTFDVTRGAEPVYGPAGGPLAQLPIAIDASGVVRSTGDFSFPPGPVYWHYQKGH